MQLQLLILLGAHMSGIFVEMILRLYAQRIRVNNCKLFISQNWIFARNAFCRRHYYFAFRVNYKVLCNEEMNDISRVCVLWQICRQKKMFGIFYCRK